MVGSCALDGAALPDVIEPTVDHYCSLYMRCGYSTRFTKVCFKVCLSQCAETVFQLAALQLYMGSSMM